MTGTEEPGEFAIQYTHHYHSAPGRAENSFCYTWLSQVLGVRPVPLFIYVYHPYHISMDRWPYLGHDSDFERRALVVTLTWGKQINCHAPPTGARPSSSATGPPKSSHLIRYYR